MRGGPAADTEVPVWSALTATGSIPRGSVWRYLDNGSDQGTAWRAPGFNDSGWKIGAAQLGYGDGDEATVIGYGPSATAKYTTSYFRRAFTVTDASQYTMLTLRLQRDDGAVVYLNGIEVFRSNMPAGAISAATLAPEATPDETRLFEVAIDTRQNPALLVNGTNVMAVEVHQSWPTSSDLSFDAELSGVPVSAPPGPATLVARGAVWRYLDNGSNQGTAWRAPGFGDAGWKMGPAQLGYGDGDEATIIGYGPIRRRQVRHHLFPPHVHGRGREPLFATDAAPVTRRRRGRLPERHRGVPAATCRRAPSTTDPRAGEQPRREPLLRSDLRP